MKITYFIGNNSATGFYRQVLPMGALRRKNLAEMVEISPGLLAGQFKYMEGSEVIAWGEVRELTDLFQKLRDQGMTIVADYCDNWEGITGFSQGYRDWGVQEFEVILEGDTCDHKAGDTVKVWSDGINFNIAENRRRRRKAREALRFFDLITTTTDILKEKLLKQGARAVEVVPDCVDFRNWKRLKLADDGWIRLFWQGSDIHYQDFKILREPLKHIMAKYPKTKLVVLGYQVKSVLRDLPADRVETMGWEPSVAAHSWRVASMNPTIGLIPMNPDPFSICKSPIKLIELAALRVPCVASFVSPYKDISTMENGIFIEDNAVQGWIDGISMLIEDAQLREDIGECAYQWAKENRDIETQCHKWVDVYQKAVEGVKCGVSC